MKVLFFQTLKDKKKQFTFLNVSQNVIFYLYSKKVQL